MAPKKKAAKRAAKKVSQPIIPTAEQTQRAKELIRDQVSDGLRRDLDLLSNALRETVNSLNRVNDKLAFYEQRIPSLKAARVAYDKKLRKAVRAMEARVKAAREAQQPATSPDIQ